MKKLFVIVGLFSLLSSAAIAQLQLATNTTTGGTFLLSTNRASVYSVELNSTYPALVKLYDQNTLSGPYFGTNFVNSAYTGVASYSTNYVTSYIGQNGITNWFTNAGVFTYTTSVSAATNELTPSASFVIGGGIYAVYNTDALFTRGIVLSANTNVSVVINYRRP